MNFESKICVFDMDGTIVDTVGFWRSCPERYLKKLGKTIKTEDRDYFKYNVLKDSISKMVNEYNLDISISDLWNLLEEEVKRGYNSVSSYKADADLFLSYLKKNNVPCVLYTANEREYINIIDNNLNLSNYFNQMYTTAEIGFKKDEREGFELIARSFGKNIEDIVLFEDSYYAIHTASILNMKSVAVADEFAENRVDDVKKECDIFISSYRQLL